MHLKMAEIFSRQTAQDYILAAVRAGTYRPRMAALRGLPARGEMMLQALSRKGRKPVKPRQKEPSCRECREPQCLRCKIDKQNRRG